VMRLEAVQLLCQAVLLDFLSQGHDFLAVGKYLKTFSAKEEMIPPGCRPSCHL